MSLCLPLKKQSGTEDEFLELWKIISYFFELRGVYHGSGSVMGLAAAKSGIQIRFDNEDRFPFFKDNIEKIRISKGQSSLEDKRSYFEEAQNIEFPKRSLLQKNFLPNLAKIGAFF